VDCSVVAIENSTGGVVHEVLDRFLDSDVKITSEIIIYIHHCLISNTTLDQVEQIYSHPQPFKQCRRWLRENLPKARYIEVASTVEGLRLAGETRGSAAIGSEIAARLNRMNILASNIQDTMENFTRFVVIGRLIPTPTGADKTSLILSLKHKPGSLFEALKCFAQKSINLTKIESRPTRQRPWEYVFFIDFEGHIHDENIKKVLKDLENNTIFIKFLGSYPSERLPK
jgi:chorismate mutase/prephenate dehydratase